MIRDLRRARIGENCRTRLQSLLRLGPWCWPTEDDPEALRRAQDLSSTNGPPTLRPGDTLLVAVDASGPSLWLPLDEAAEPPAALPNAIFGREAKSAWKDSVVGLQRSLPLLWESLSRASTPPERAVRIGAVPVPGSAPHIEVLEGRSFGLSFLLALASRVLSLPLPADLIASAAVAVDGRLLGVGALEQKVRVLQEFAPRIGRILVATEDLETARNAVAGTSIEVVSLGHASKVFDLVFGAKLVDSLVDAGGDPTRRSLIVESFFRLAMGGRGQLLDWKPVERAASLALKRWTELGREERIRLELARDVSARHEGSHEPASMPAAEWIESLPLPLRQQLAASLVQHSADTGGPVPREIERFARTLLGPTTRNAHLPELRLRGALGRLLAVTGRLVEALGLQREAALAFLDLLHPEDVSYPLAEWYRLAGVLSERDSLLEADRVRRRVLQLGGFGLWGDPYVDLARSKALVLLGYDDGEFPAERLRKIAADSSIPSHVRWSGARWHARWLAVRGDDDASRSILESMRSAAEADGRDAPQARRFWLLASLDRALRAGDASVAVDYLGRLQEMQPGLFANLMGAEDPGTATERVALHYPY